MIDSSLVAFGFSHPPFTKEISDQDLWLPPSKQVIVDDLVEAIEARHSVLLAGEAGVGKTCVLRALRQRLPKEPLSLPGMSPSRPRPLIRSAAPERMRQI